MNYYCLGRPVGKPEEPKDFKGKDNDPSDEFYPEDNTEEENG